MALMYLARYIIRNGNQTNEYETHFYYEKCVGMLQWIS